MEIRLGNDIKFGGDSIYQIQPPLSGLGVADIRVGDGLYTGTDGGYVSTEFYGMRTIVIKGFFVTNGCQSMDEARLGLIHSLRIRYLYPIFIKTFAGKNFFTEGYLTDLKADITGPKAGEFQITLLCPDPIIYDGGNGNSTDSAWFEQTFYKEGHGGFDMEYNTPVQWTSGDQVTSINNIGLVDSYPTIILTGKFTNPVITNLTTNKFIDIETTTTDSDTIVIDMKNRTITKNGGSIAAYRTIDSSWWSLVQGDNRIVLTTDSQTDKNFGVIRYRLGYGGI